MSVPSFLKALPVAFIALGAIAVASSAANATQLNAPASIETASTSNAWGVTKLRVGSKKRKHATRQHSSSRFSGFGFRGDGFRTSGKYK